MEKEFSRRSFLGRVAAGAGVAAASPMALALANLSAPAKSPRSANRLEYEAASETPGLLTDERFRIGAQFRMNQFIQKGADPQDAEEIFRTLPNLDAQPWVDAWTRLAEPLERRGAELETQGKHNEASQAYQK